MLGRLRDPLPARPAPRATRSPDEPRAHRAPAGPDVARATREPTAPSPAHAPAAGSTPTSFRASLDGPPAVSHVDDVGPTASRAGIETPAGTPDGHAAAPGPGTHVSAPVPHRSPWDAAPAAGTDGTLVSPSPSRGRRPTGLGRPFARAVDDTHHAVVHVSRAPLGDAGPAVPHPVGQPVAAPPVRVAREPAAPAGASAPDAPAEPTPPVGEVVAAGAPPATGRAESPADLAGLADRLWGHLETRLRSTLLLERERRGALPDL